MGNQTDFNQTLFNFRPNIWYSDMIISGILGVISLYLLIASIFHQVKVEKPRRQLFLQLSLENKLAVLSKGTCIIVGIASFTRNWISFVWLWLEFKAVFPSPSIHQEIDADSACDIFPRLSNIVSAIGSGFVYLLLWFRQRVFYIHPSLKILNNKVVLVFSNGIMALWLLYYFSLYVCYFILVQYHFTKQGGCLVTESSHNIYSYLLLSWICTTIFIQIVLLGLFIYPILKRKLWQSHQNIDGDSCLLRRVKKAVILALICLVTDILYIVTLPFTFVKDSSGGIFAYSLNLAINHLVTIACFDYWKKLLWPWHLKPIEDSLQNRRKSEGISTMSTQDYSNNTTNVTAIAAI